MELEARKQDERNESGLPLHAAHAVFHDLQHGRAEQHHEQWWEDAGHERQQHKNGQFHCSFLCSLATFGAKFVGLDLEHVSN